MVQERAETDDPSQLVRWIWPYPRVSLNCLGKLDFSWYKLAGYLWRLQDFYVQ